MRSPHRLALALGLTLLPASLLAPGAAAQGRSPADARAIESHRLTMPMLRKVLPALSAPGSASCPRERRDPRTLGLAEMTQTIERCAPMAQALRRAGVPSREAALVMGSLYRTSEAVAIRRGDVNAVDAGPLRDNALLMQQNDAEIKRLMGDNQ
jgi:hypothetical protein